MCVSRLEYLSYLSADSIEFYLMLNHQFGHILSLNQTGLQVNLDKAKCRICRKKISVLRGNTSNLRSHLRINHPVTEVFARAAKYQRDLNNWRALTLS